MNATERQKLALATRDAHSALLDLKKLVDDATQTTHAAEIEAVGFAVNRSVSGGTLSTLRVAVHCLQSPNLETTLSQARQKLEEALAWHKTISL